MAELLTSADAARRFGVTLRTLLNWRRQGAPFHRYGGSIRYDESELRRWARERSRNGRRKERAN